MTPQEKQDVLKEVAEKLKGKSLFPEQVARAQEFLSKAKFIDDPVSLKSRKTIHQHVMGETLSPLNMGLYYLGIVSILYFASKNGIRIQIPKSWTLDPKDSKTIYTYKIKWNFWNPLTIPAMLIISAVLIVFAQIWIGLQGLGEVLGELWKYFFKPEEQSA